MDSDECRHRPRCPAWNAVDAAAAHVVSDRGEQGWSLLCNGIVLFDDLSALAPDGSVVDSRYAMPSPRVAGSGVLPRT